MNPILFQVAQRLGPMLSRIRPSGAPGSLLGTLPPLSALGIGAAAKPPVDPTLPQVPISGPDGWVQQPSPQQVPISGPNGWVKQDGSPYHAPQQVAPLPSTNVAARPIADPFAITPQAQAVPIPQPRPAQAPQPATPAPDMPWYMRNAMMQTDENGQALNPQLAELAQRYFRA
jgi:hypothetical protein